MARIKYGSIVSSVSGSIGSATYQKSLYGDTLRNKPVPRRSSTALQINRRGIMMQLHAAWRSLTDAERRQWNQYISYSSARIRRDKNVLQTGHSLFIQYNFMRLINNIALMTVPVYVPMPEVFPGAVFGWYGAGDLRMSIVTVGMGTDVWFLAKLSAPRPESQSFNPAGLLAILVPVVAQQEFEIGTQYAAAFGRVALPGEYIHYSVRQFSLLSPILASEFHGKDFVTDES